MQPLLGTRGSARPGHHVARSRWRTFDGGVTITVSETTSAGFTLVRNQAKLEAPLAALVRNRLIISTIAEITFYGRDQTGREASVTGRIDVHFGNFGDPQ